MPRFLPAVLCSAACLIASLGAVPGCVIVCDNDWDGYQASASARLTKSQTVPHLAGKPLKVSTDNGDIKITAAAGSDVSIVGQLRGPSQERLDQAEILATRLADGTLDISVKWPEGKRRNNEGCAFEIKLPDVERMKLETGNGDIEIAGFAGPADLTTSNGDVDAKDHHGPVKARSSNGDVILTRVESADAETSNGDVELRLSGPGPANGSTSNGSVAVTVGPAFAGTISANTSNGTVKTRAARGIVVGTVTKTRGEWKFGEGPTSRLITSNGSITIND